jgi:hypothetical protein
MAGDTYVWTAARLLLDSMGEEATDHAADRAEESWTLGDLQAARVWQQIGAAICELSRQPHEGDAIH